MKKILTTLISTMILLFAGSVFAFTPPPPPENGWFVLDQAGKLTPDQITSLNQKIENMSKVSKNEFAVVILKSLDGEEIAEVAQNIFRTWGIGKMGLNNGVLLLISIDERKTRIQTGKNIEGELPDLLCSDILSKTLRPRLKSGDFFGGINATLDDLSSHLESRANVPVPVFINSSATSSDSSGIGWILLAVLVVPGLICLAFFISWHQKKKSEREWEKSQKKFDEKRIRRANQRNVQMWEQKARETQVNLNGAFKDPHFGVVSNPVHSHTSRSFPRPLPDPPSFVKSSAAVVGAGGVLAADEFARKRRAQEEEDENRRRREREDEEDRARRRRESESTWSSPPSSPSFGGGSDFGGGFGGGDVSGGGASGDF